jgi:hypothetical protein
MRDKEELLLNILFVFFATCFTLLILSALVIFPYKLGWDILLEDYYLTSPYSYFKYYKIKGGGDFLKWIVVAVIFNLLLFISFIRRSNSSQLGADFDKPQKYLFINHNKIRPLYFLYLIYLSPTIFVWFYPFLLKWFEKQSEQSIYQTDIPFLFKVLGYLFLFGLLFTLYRIIKVNRSSKLFELKEEIKKELLSDEKK